MSAEALALLREALNHKRVQIIGQRQWDVIMTLEREGFVTRQTVLSCTFIEITSEGQAHVSDQMDNA